MSSKSKWAENREVIVWHKKSTKTCERYDNGNMSFVKAVIYIDKDEFEGKEPPLTLTFVVKEMKP